MPIAQYIYVAALCSGEKEILVKNQQTTLLIYHHHHHHHQGVPTVQIPLTLSRHLSL